MQCTIDRVNNFIKAAASIISALFLLSSFQVNAGVPAQNPVFLSSQVQPLLMLNMSRDHQLYFKLYDDYADITDSRKFLSDGVTANPNYGFSISDGNADTTYVHGYNYFGYFDSNRCYTYDTTDKRFEPSTTASKTCVDMWSGNFLNWATMTRVDAIRKILYGGLRVATSDTTTETVLERSYLPNDTHSFAKFYKGDDLASLVPTAVASSLGITLCNTTDATATYSQLDSQPPLIKVARGDYSLWANNERWQCKWKEQERSGATAVTNGNDSSKSGLNAKAFNPSSAASEGSSSYVARVQTCVSGRTGDDEGCTVYGSTQKPTGLLQEYGATKFESDNTTIKQKAAVLFGLMTGSYDSSKSGGVLRKAIGTLDNEINVATGQFVTAPTNNIINTLNLLKIYGYDTRVSKPDEGGTYMGPPSLSGVWYSAPTETSGSDNCGWIGSTASNSSQNNYPRAAFDNNRCSNWGNPQAEIYLESLRYLAGGTQPTDAFKADDTKFIPGLTSVKTWSDPLSTAPDGNYCAPLNVLMFNASVTSYDADELSSVNAIGLTGLTALSAKTDAIGVAESIAGNNFFIGKTPSNNDQLCTAKNIANLSGVSGICPEAPRLEGGFQMAGLAYHARSTGIASAVINGKTEVRKVKTFAVAMAPATPKVTVRVNPTSTTDLRTFTIIPACRNTSTYIDRSTPRDASCAIVDFKIVAQTNTTGTLYVDWEDMEQGSDFDQDMWGTIKYVVNPSTGTVTITTYVAAESTGNKMGFGYILSGTQKDGFKVYSGIHGFIYDEAGSGCTTLSPCNAANSSISAQTKTYDLGISTSGKALEDPLKYAAKWGGYDDDSPTAASIAASQPANYFFATDPRKLKASLKIALDKISKTVAASATAASSSTKLETDTLVYQAIFSSTDWSGKILAYKTLASGSPQTTPEWTTDTTLARTGRTIYTYDGGTTRSLVNLSTTNFTSLSTDASAIRANLKVGSESTEVNATKRYNWLLGSAADETVKDTDTGAVKSGTLRARASILGDIVNSTPALAGRDTQHYEALPASYGSSSYSQYVKDVKIPRIPVLYVGANDGMLHAFNGKTGQELFAYIPRGAYSKLAGLSSLTFNHQFIVDGPVTVGDAYVQLAGETTKSWHTIVAGAQGAGGRGVFALDVTNPASPKVIFDSSDTDSTISYKNDLGYNSGKIFIVPTAAASGGNSWSVVFGNGGNSVNGYAKMIAINLENASATVIDTKAKIATGDVLANGLSEVSLIPNGNGIYTYGYAGDIMGNMWKFDLTSTASSGWKVAYGTASAPLPLIKVVDPSGVPQPITAPPTIGKNVVKLTSDAPPVPSNMVYFGTGKLSETGDKTTTQIQTLYAILDSGSAITTLTTTNRATVLHQKTISTEANGQRTIINDKTPDTGVLAVDWKGERGSAKRGWFLDLTFGSTTTGERIIAKPLLLYDRVVINTFIPSTFQCDFGGSGWLMELTGVGDKFIGYDLLGAHGNHILDNVILGSLIAIFGGKEVDIVGSGLKPGPKGNFPTEILRPAPPDTYGRMSWRQLK